MSNYAFWETNTVQAQWKIGCEEGHYIETLIIV